MRSRVVAFPATSIDGAAQEQTGQLQVPSGAAPAGGWPVVVYGHMTTGGSPRSAPSAGGPSHREWRRMSQGDALCAALVHRGIVVLRPDYEGIGGPGAHPYLIGSSLAASMTAMLRARDSFNARLGDTWVAAGHSEGAVAALHASVASEADERTRLVGTAAFAPVTRMDLSIRAARRVPGRYPGSGVVSALIALMLSGAATTDARMRELLAADGLSTRAAERLPDVDRLCLTELAAAESWGGIAPSRIGGPRGRELFALLDASFRANEVAGLTGFRAPVRIDAARFDEVAPAALSARLLRTYRRAGVALTSRWWPTHHSGTMHPQHAPSEAADWIAARLRASA
ncbi:lipase [Microbacterium bovistercoris]|uniref:Lipase n=1 Tax=Microbacterium bovistercoris TaxID=2293570 RepID=A0A371NQI1_9MICO|nr:lipase family protein [Microbacterium bovistercoris]REJ03977.1 lipase [Microbacterium bovistercoris]